MSSKELIRKRGSIKGKFTTFKNFLDTYEENPDTLLLRIRLDRIKPELNEFETVQNEIERTCTDEEYDNQGKERSNRIQLNTPSQINFPRLDLPKFSGSGEAWPAFADAFRASVHNDKRFSDVQKLIYLKSCLIGNAANKLEALPITDINYSVAWNLLENAYHDPNLLTQTHVKAFFDLPRCEKPSKAAIGKLFDRGMKHYRTLEALKVPFLEAFPIYALTSKLDEETRQKWRESNKKNDRPTMEKLFEFGQERYRVLEDTTDKTQKNHNFINNKKNNESNKPYKHVSSTSLTAGVTNSCAVYQKDHFTQYCEDLTKLSIDEREKLIGKLKLCYNCLRNNHVSKNCRAGGCKTCNKKHHTLLHKESFESNISSAMTCLSGTTSSQVLLSTAVVEFLDYKGKIYCARVLLDLCSQTNFITEKLAKKLNQKDSNFSVELPYLIRERFEGLIPSFSVDIQKLEIPSDITLADPDYHKPGQVDALLGAKIFFKLLGAKQRFLNSRDTLLQKTQLGWVVTGDVPIKTTIASLICHMSIENLNMQLERFWAIEQVPTGKTRSPEEKFCEKHYKLNTTRDDSDGRYVVRLPFNENKGKLGSSYKAALKRFFSLERSLERNLDLKTQYSEFLKEYENMGHMSEREHSNNLLYLPHHGVLKQNSLTTKLRVVFDASAKTVSGISLNDALCVGPILQEDLIHLILRFRIHAVVLTADIEKMYRQINLHNSDRGFQNILWRNNVNEKIKSYQLNTVTYGTAPASFLATRTLQQLADDEVSDVPEATRAIKEDFYMDDLLTGASSIAEAKILRDEIIRITASAKLPLRKWAFNEPTLLKDLTVENANINVSLNPDDTIKTLGLYWNAKDDVIAYTLKQSPQHQITKRNILSAIARLFDPLGILGPVIVRAKLIMQKLWQIKLGWDESLPASIGEEWIKFEEELVCINNIKINRRVVLPDYLNLELHGFSDASEDAYGACIYVKTTTSNESFVQLLCAKSKVAPLKTISLPKLELCGALLLSRLLTVVRSALRHLNFRKITCWSDSTITLSWIRTPSRTLKTFVSNRVAEIQELTADCTWRYVPSSDNPADVISRGLGATDFLLNSLWHEGPTWLSGNGNDWPENNFEIKDVPELKFISNLAVLTSEILQRYSDFRKLVRIVAFCTRFVNNCRRVNVTRAPILEVEEIKRASLLIIRLTQAEGFADEVASLKKHHEIKGKMSPLSPFLDNQNILRVGGRLANAQLKFENKHPMILPRHHHVTKLIIIHTHERAYHAGVQATLNLLRQRYWIIDGKQYLKTILYKCVRCRRMKPTIPDYLMGNLPSNRVNYSRPFLHTGIDLCGPLFVKEKRFRNRKKVKIYIAVFVCFSTRAIHLELVEDLSCEAFLAALKRFTARRGRASDLYSDNATNFVGTKHYFDEAQKFLIGNKTQIENRLTIDYIKWHFIPPRAPHFGGLWEAAVKSVKRHLIHVAKDTLLTYEALLTFLLEIEAILNSRPLTPISMDPNDLEALTPGYFLIGEALTGLPELDFNKSRLRSCNNYAQLVQMRKHFWFRWSKEYLQTLTVRRKWHSSKETNMKIGTLVIVRENNLPPLKWPMGRIIETYPGEDGIIRAVTIKTATGEYKRAVKELSPLPIES